MGKRTGELDEEQKHFINEQKIFFVATAPADGHINLSPKGMDSLRVLDSSTVLWLNLTGSGNETAAHVLENGRMTIMFCAFEGRPMILRLYGNAKTIHPRDSEWSTLIGHFPPSTGARQLFRLTIELVQTSCGFGVPLLNYVEDRRLLPEWIEKKGEAGIHEYWRDRNGISLDGAPTRILED